MAYNPNKQPTYTIEEAAAGYGVSPDVYTEEYADAYSNTGPSEIVYSPDGRAFDAREVAEAYGSSGYDQPARSVTHQSANNHDTINQGIQNATNTAKAIILTGSAAAGGTAMVAPEMTKNTIEAAQNLVETAPGTTAMILGGVALAATAGWYTVRNFRKRRRTHRETQQIAQVPRQTSNTYE